MARRRASMREGPLAELFKATEAAQRQAERAESGGEPEPSEADAATVEHAAPEPAERTLSAAPEPAPTPAGPPEPASTTAAPAAAPPSERRYEEPPVSRL
ncbi:MAG TPA: hypothetical protein VK496_02015, partial [Gaiellaceae bacterium]|nr:hypothetical protein [Gaiellaceae bacterium]